MLHAAAFKLRDCIFNLIERTTKLQTLNFKNQIALVA